MMLTFSGEIVEVEAHADDASDACRMKLCLGPDMEEVTIPLATVEDARLAGANLFRPVTVTIETAEAPAEPAP